MLHIGNLPQQPLQVFIALEHATVTALINIVSKGRGESSTEHNEIDFGVPTLLAGIAGLGLLVEEPWRYGSISGL